MFEKHLFQILNKIGWSTTKKIIVIESDDWGSIRMPSVDSYNRLVTKGVTFGKLGYDQFDTIASKTDLEKLFEECQSIRDSNGRPVTITANCVVANPDFDKIRESGYKEYHYETILQTMERYYPGTSPFPIWKQGMKEGVFHPQFHGREHVNVQMWLRSLQNAHKGALDCFEEGVFSFKVQPQEDKRIKNTSAFEWAKGDNEDFYLQSIEEGLRLFNSLFGYDPKSFIAPSFTMRPSIIDCLANHGVKFIQTVMIRKDGNRIRFSYTGQRNRNGQIFTVRNAGWEPSQYLNKDCEQICLRNIEEAFTNHKPAIISMHRLNFIGELHAENRDSNLLRFKELMTTIVKKWPSVVFMTSDELGELIISEKK